MQGCQREEHQCSGVGGGGGQTVDIRDTFTSCPRTTEPTCPIDLRGRIECERGVWLRNTGGARLALDKNERRILQNEIGRGKKQIGAGKKDAGRGSRKIKLPCAGARAACLLHSDDPRHPVDVCTQPSQFSNGVPRLFDACTAHKVKSYGASLPLTDWQRSCAGSGI